MPLTMAQPGVDIQIKRILGKKDTRKFLESLGFITGSEVNIISHNMGNIIVNIKGTRIALNEGIAKYIMV
ncbi:MAG: FeoA family protein [Clostridium sp.]